jgi:transposase
MTRLYGWGERHVRVEDYVPDVRFERSSVLSVVCLSGVGASVSFNETLNGELFALYVKYVLAPILNAGDVVLLDSLSSHKAEGFWILFMSGAFVWFLPVYSPDFNPIELVWSKMKAVLRKLEARTTKDTRKALKRASDAITLMDIKNWFSHNGYRTISI